MIHLDLFSGIGGFSLGLKRAGMPITKTYFSEIDKHAIANYLYNNTNAEHIGAVEHILNAGIERVDIITFGSPCQDFSLAGNRAGLDGGRSSLIHHAINAIHHFRPRVFIWENVKGVFSSNNGADFWAIIQAFANIGSYRLEWQLVNTLWFLPQNRERVYSIGHFAGRSECGIFPLGKNDETMPKKEWNKGGHSRTITANYRSAGHCGTFIDVGTYRTRKEGKGLRQMKSNVSPTITGRARSDGDGQVCVRVKTGDVFAVKGDIVTRENPQRQNGISHDSMFTLRTAIPHYVSDNTKLRRLTEIECERLQGYPDDYTKYGNYDGTIKEVPSTQRYKMLGNSITVNVMEAIAKKIKLT